MKRIALLTVLLLVVSLAAFAIDVKPTVALTGSASVTWGYNLDDGANGFLNSSDADLTVSLLAADGSDTHAGTGAMYGSITISNLELYWTDGAMTMGPADTDVSAKIVITPFEIGVYAAPGMTKDFFGALEDADAPDLVVDSNEGAFGMTGANLLGTHWGTWVSGTFGPAVVTAKIVSAGDWTDGTTGYAAGAEAVLTFAPLTVSAGAYMDFVNAPDMSFYAKVAADMAPIVAWGALEANATTPDMALAAGGGLTFTLVKDTTLAVTAWYGDVYQGLDLQVVFTEPEAGLIPMLDTSIKFNLLDVGALKAAEWELVTATGYKIGLNSDNTNYARPYLNFTYGSANDGVDDTTAVAVMNAEAGLQLQVIPLTLLTAKWVSGAALAADLASTPAVLGSVQFVATVTY